MSFLYRFLLLLVIANSTLCLSLSMHSYQMAAIQSHPLCVCWQSNAYSVYCRFFLYCLFLWCRHWLGRCLEESMPRSQFRSRSTIMKLLEKTGVYVCVSVCVCVHVWNFELCIHCDFGGKNRWWGVGGGSFLPSLNSVHCSVLHIFLIVCILNCMCWSQYTCVHIHYMVVTKK